MPPWLNNLFMLPPVVLISKTNQQLEIEQFKWIDSKISATNYL